MEIKEAIELIWDNRKYMTNDPRQALSHLNEEVAESLRALMMGDQELAKKELEDALSCLFIALRVMEIDAEEVVRRQVEKMRKKNSKVMVIKDNRVDIYVGGELTGGWSVWGREDKEEAERIGKEFGCVVIREEVGGGTLT